VARSAASVIELVRSEIARKGLGARAAAAEIGVTEDSLVRHLSGAYVRSDSLAKYRVWLNGDAVQEPQLDLLPGSATKRKRSPLEHIRLSGIQAPRAGWRVVDLFSGCGGLSLGFELLGDGSLFETVLAVDVEDAMVDTFNVNHCTTPAPVARKVDLSEFINASEVRGFYLDHLRHVEPDEELDAALGRGKPISIDTFQSLVSTLDRKFLDAFEQFRGGAEFAAAYARLDSRVLGQTSVQGFHDALRIPLPSTRKADLAAMIWAATHDEPLRAAGKVPREFAEDWLEMEEQVRPKLAARWDAEVNALRKRGEGNGRGQLASSADRIRRFLGFLDEVPSLREVWLDWRARRDSLRFLTFGDHRVGAHLADTYTDERRVAVVLGGPPCQGFSRIGRGKIRSLRDDRVHVHYDAAAGDLRNRLFEKYVLFVSALSPDVFLFENVRHFQTEVKTPEGTFLATDILAEAIRELSVDGLDYLLASRTIMASDHLVPQSRERFFMAGVRETLLEKEAELPDASEWILTLPVQPEVPVRFALHDLPAPLHVGSAGAGGALDRSIALIEQPDHERSDAATRYTTWIRQSRGAPEQRDERIDSHVARDHRRDDREWFALMGPGKRWMDYRCDGSETLALLARTIQTLKSVAEQNPEVLKASDAVISVDDLSDLESRIDGHLSIRLLLETIQPLPGELDHHLLKDTYLRKREGNHGDWLARLDATRPSKTVVTHMGKDTYAYIHPWEDRSLSVREAARIQTFPDTFSFGHLGLVDAFRVIGNAVPPLLSNQMADRVAQLLSLNATKAPERDLEAVG
jgi:site-specific DNA-cytosine methylase